ncbi:hypothetical protein CUMW_050730 [Citrus unshiu]|nr:hypothetical protein CUMW_050730 [Citrus unshiu]
MAMLVCIDGCLLSPALDFASLRKDLPHLWLGMQQPFPRGHSGGTMEDTNQKPAYCGLASLSMVLNALGYLTWKKMEGCNKARKTLSGRPWRWFDESMLDCCEPLEKVKEKGISFGKLVCLAHCAGAKVEAFRTNQSTIDDFRKYIIRCSASEDCHVISSYHRGAFKQSCKHENWVGIAKYLLDEVPKIVKSKDFKDFGEVLTVLFTSLPSNFGEFVKWVAEVRRREDGDHSLSQEEKGRLALKEEVLRQVQETLLFKHVVTFLSSVNSCCRSMSVLVHKNELPDIAEKVCCQGARILAGKFDSSERFYCRETCVKCLKANSDKPVTLVSGTVVNGNDILTVLILALPKETWSGIRDEKLSRQILGLVTTENLPTLLQEEVLHLRRQLHILRRCQENKKQMLSPQGSNDLVNDGKLLSRDQNLTMKSGRVYRRVLPSPPAIEFASPQGKKLFTEALEGGTMEGFFKLISYYQTQSEPAYCGLASLAVGLGDDCCEPLSKIKNEGITFGKVSCLAFCNGANVEAFRTNESSIDEFRRQRIPMSSPHTIEEFLSRFMTVSRIPKAPSILYTVSCRHEGWNKVAKYLTEDVPLRLKSDDVKSVENLLSVIFKSAPADLKEFIKWVAEVRRQEDGSMILSEEEKGRLVMKEEVLKQTRETELFKYVAKWSASKISLCKGVTSWGLKETLPELAADICCQGAELFMGKLSSSEGTCCRQTSVTLLKVDDEKAMTVVSGTVTTDGIEKGIETLVPSSITELSNLCDFDQSNCKGMHPSTADVLTVLLLALPQHTWSGIKEEELRMQFNHLASVDKLPSLLQQEVIHFSP